MKIFTTSKEPTELAAIAARECLARAGCSAQELDAILWCSAQGLTDERRNELHVQQLLGARRAFAMVGGAHCSELVSTLWMADMMIRGWPGVRNVLVASGEKYTSPSRTIPGMSAQVRYQPVFSDVGAAALLRAGGGTRLLSVSSATDGDSWDRFQSVARNEAQDFEGLIGGMVEASRIDGLALERCLSGAGLSAAELHHYILTRESPEVVGGIVRRMGLDARRIVHLPSGPSHGGASDGLFGLEALLHGGRGQPGENVLLCSRTLGIARFALLRLGAPTARASE
jgi:3-oxoacyl-[acyl-carrier-protein] synthase III